MILSPFSAVIITFNEELRLPKCLDSIAFADEIVVVDSGSTDRTLEIAESKGCRVIRQPWLGYGPQKRFAVDRAVHNWVLCLDADEWVSRDLMLSIQAALSEPGSDAYRVARCNQFLGRWLRHGEGYPDWTIRLFNRTRAQWSNDCVHEKVEVNGSVERLAGDLMHESGESLEQYLAKQNVYTSLQAQSLFNEGKKSSLGKILLSPALRFMKMYFIRRGFLDGVPGLVHIMLGCMNSFVKYVKLLALYRDKK